MNKIETSLIRKKILKLAFAGKLIEDDDNEMSVSLLLEEIDRNRGKKNKKISKIYCGENGKYYERVGSETKDITNEIPNSAPDNWIKVRLKDIGDFGMGQTILTNEMTATGIPVYSATMDDKPLGYCSKEKIRIFLSEGDLVIPARGASIGYLTYINDESATCTQTTIYCKFCKPIVPKFLYYQFMSNEEYYFPISGTAQPQLVVSSLTNKIVVLPSVEEQKHIVKKIEMLLDKLDEIDREQNELQKMEELVKKKILSSACQGKLVHQNPNEEPASILLDNIRREKEKLIKEDKIKKDKNGSTIYKSEDGYYYEKIGNKETDITEEIPFEIPNSWSYVKLKNIAKISSGGTPSRTKKAYWKDGTIPWLKIQDLTSSGKYVNKSSEFITIEGLNNSSAKIVKKGAILYTIFATIGEVKILNFDASCNQAIAAVEPYNDETRDYLYYYLTNLQDIIKTNSHGVAQQNINLSILSQSIVCIPPLNEQKRIVDKLDQIFEILS